MAATGYTPISLFYSTTAAAAPLNTSLVNGELAINITDGKLYYKDNSGVVQTIASKDANSGTFTNATVSGNLTLSGGTANGVLYLNGSKVTTSGSALVFDGTNFSTTGTATATKLIPTGNVTAGNGMYLPTTNTLAWSTNGAEGMRLDSSGNLGLGVSAPNYKLDIASGAIQVKTGASISNSQYDWLIGYSGTEGYGVKITTIQGSTSTRHGMAFYTSAAALPAERMRIDETGNLGLGVTPSAWGSGSYKGFQIGGSASFMGRAGGSDAYFMANAYFNQTDYKYTSSLSASLYSQNAGGHFWWNAPSGTAGNTITFTQAMTLDASGNLGIGTTGPGSRLNVDGGSLATVGNGAMLAGSITTGRLLSGGGANLQCLHTYYDSQAYEISAGSSSGYVSGIGIGARSYSGTGGDAITFWTRSTERLRIDSSGNLGLGVTPSGSRTGLGYQALQVRGATFTALAGSTAYLTSNCYQDSAGAITYYSTDVATLYSQSAGVHAWFSYASGTAGTAVSGGAGQAMTLDASGNLGIGTTSPTDLLCIGTLGTTASPILTIGSSTTGTGQIYFGDGTGTARYRGYIEYGHTSDYMAFGTAATERARITSGGEVLIGATTQSSNYTARLYVECNASSISNVTLRDTGTTYGTSTQYISFTNSTPGLAGSIQHNAATTVNYATSSDIRLKENIVDAPNALDVLNQIPVRSYDWKEDKHHVEYGFIAQELNPYFPEAVCAGDDGETISDPKQTWQVDYGKITPLLLKAIQELNSKVEAQAAEIAALKGN